MTDLDQKFLESRDQNHHLERGPEHRCLIFVALINQLIHFSAWGELQMKSGSSRSGLSSMILLVDRGMLGSVHSQICPTTRVTWEVYNTFPGPTGITVLESPGAEAKNLPSDMFQT